MGKRKRTKALTETPTTSAKRIKDDADTVYLNELHQDSNTLLADLLVGEKLVFVEGTVGCGKTSLVKRVAQHLNLPLVTLQLSDQVDAKTFIGSYQCTEVPGEFIWEPSVFSKAITKRCLILLEDIDSATTELVSSLYLMRKSWNAPLHSDGTIAAFHPDARIVATVRLENHNSDSAELIRSHPMRVTLKALSTEELKQIVDHKFPSLKPVSEKLLNIFIELSELMSADSVIDRDLNANDLIRACRRLSQFSKLDNNQQIFIELADIYVFSVSNISKRISLAAVLAKHLSISDQNVHTLINVRVPTVSRDVGVVTFGRTKIPVRKGASTEVASKQFGLTTDVKRLMEQIAVCIQQGGNEAVLLTGETGVGKTSVIQMMARYANASLDVVNLSQDSDSTDLIGGYKPIGTLELLSPLIDTVDVLLKNSFDVIKNAKFLSHFTNLIIQESFTEYLTLTEATARKAIENNCGDQLAWADVLVRCQRLSKALNSRKSALPFAYVEGIVSKAAKHGHWLLVDEINLASNECLDAIIHVFDGVIDAHPDFRLFACMNPATDTGKKKLPIGIRTRFTEFFVNEPYNREQRTTIVMNYLPTIEALNLNRLLNFYDEIITLFPRKFSLRNLCRALSFAGDNLYGNPYRSLFEGVSMAFGSDLDNDAMIKFNKLLLKHFENVPIGVARTSVDNKKILVEGSYIEKGDKEPQSDPHYVYTESIKKNLSRLSRAVASGRFPILLEGETSAGKTSMILDLALVTGNVVHRINNHEHTDIQEYIGCYAPNEEGKLTFVEGVLLQAVRKGHWVILDELNLAPVEVLEALNRLLDDNRELFVAERNLVVKAHPRFRLFATQNPVGTYAGRKRLSRAFLNRFVVMRFDHPPFEELAQIVCARCGIANSPAVTMIKVLTELKKYRSNVGIFNAVDGLMTLRDLFRWANRLAKSDSGEWRQVLADQGYFLLAARCRNVADADEVVRVLEDTLKVKIDIEKLFAINSPYLPEDIAKKLTEGIGHVVSTYGMRRMLILASEAWRCSEPILMVGETGCGKTTAAQILSAGNLLSINCHERTETSDLLGSIRPKADGSFFWQDGVVVQAMKNGSKLLIDEISLASDSVLERLNPLLESSRTVLLTDAGADAEIVVANLNFQVVATMNPGTDHGKKELSKALRNRFTEIWCSCDHPVEDIKKIVARRMTQFGYDGEEELIRIVNAIVEFFTTFIEAYGSLFRTVFSIRDIIAAADLFLACRNEAGFSSHSAFVNSLTGVVMDSIGVLPARTLYDPLMLKQKCSNMVLSIAEKYQINPIIGEAIIQRENCIVFGDFPITAGKLSYESVKHYSFSTPTTEQNVIRVARALLLEKPIMLEGSPGAGKSSLIVALAKATGHPLVRLNLSDQTDLSDLFGHDVPVSKSDGSITFHWQDGPILKAIKEGAWILLDEMNLASQSVLEGLNSCFDFRQELFIAELNKKFVINSSDCRFFACQNPQTQGGNRRALPKSFLNRFTLIYIESFGPQDFSMILNQELSESRLVVEKMIRFNRKMRALTQRRCVGIEFEFNMRDLLRWAQFILEYHNVAFGAEILYISRLSTLEIQKEARTIYGKIFDYDLLLPKSDLFFDDNAGICFGNTKYNLPFKKLPDFPLSNLLLLSSQAALLQQLCVCIKMNWVVLLNGPRLTGKSSLVETLSILSQSKLKRMRLNKDTDASELLGSYEQILDYKIIEQCCEEFTNILKTNKIGTLNSEQISDILKELQTTLITDVHQLRCKVTQLAALANDDIKNQLNNIASKLSKVYLSFEWRSSIFVDAYRNGDWLLIEDVNCCSAAVLDRLNCCLESGGKLVLPEQIDGDIEEIEPHPDFRVFFTMDSKNGTLSRAMKNRCVEFLINSDNSWYGDYDSAINVVLAKEPLMCASLNNIEWQCDINLEQLKNFLRTAARTNVSLNDRLLEINHALDLSPPSSNYSTDKVTFRVVSSKNSADRDCPLLLTSNRQPRLPFAEHPLYECHIKHGMLPDVLFSELQIQEYSFLANYQNVENQNVTLPECQLAFFVLAVMSSSSDCLRANNIFYKTFTEIDELSKKKVIDIILELLKIRNKDRSSTPWDLRFFDVSEFNFIPDAAIDRRLFHLLCVWLKKEMVLMVARANKDSPYSQSNAFQNGVLHSETLGNAAYGPLSQVLSKLVDSLEQFEIEEISTDTFYAALEFVFRVAAIIDLSVNTSDKVHSLLLLRQSFQNIDIDCYNTGNHIIWQQLFMLFKSDKKLEALLHRFTTSLGVSSERQTTHYVDSLTSVCAVNPLEEEVHYLCLKNKIPGIQEAYLKSKHSTLPGHLSLDFLVKGLQDFLKSYVIFKNMKLEENILIHFPEACLQHLEILQHFTYDNSVTRDMVMFLTVMNSNMAVRNISPSLRTIHLSSVEVLLDIVLTFWKAFQFSPKSFSAIPLKSLAAASEKISEYQAFIWIIRQTIQDYGVSIRKQALNSTNNFLRDVSTDHMFFQECRNLFQSLLPPKGAVDPGLADIVNLEVKQSEEKIFQLFASCPKVFPAEASSHPILRYLHNKISETSSLIDCLKQKRTKVYRSSDLKFDEISSVLRNFYNRFDTALNEYQIRTEDWHRSVRFSIVLDHSTRTNNLISLAQSFCERLLIEYYDLPDVILPVYVILQCFLMTFHFQWYLCERFLKLRKINKEYGNIGIDLYDLRPSVEMFENIPVALEIALSGRNGFMPMQFQYEVAKYLLSFPHLADDGSGNSSQALNWIMQEWRLWYENHKEKREKMFVYKTTALKQTEDGGDEHETMEDPEDIEIRALLPDFDNAEFEKVEITETYILSRLPDAKDICKIIDAIMTSFQTTPDRRDIFLPAVWILDFFNHTSALLNPYLQDDSNSYRFVEHSNLMDEHLLAITQFQELLLPHVSKEVINVYTENDKAEVTRGVNAIYKLQARVDEVREEFPEEANLKEISEIIQTFLNADSGASQLKLTSWVEKVLEKCENWQKLASRQYSLIDQLQELQEILLDWRKMQVRSWHHIIDSVKSDSQAIAVTMGFPIIETIIGWRTGPKVTAATIDNFLAMIIDWIQSSTLIDFESRLKISKFAAVLVEKFYADIDGIHSVGASIRSIVFYFAAYHHDVEEKLKNKRAEVVQELENFVNIVKFHDLNLWSVKSSAEKAHQKLFRIIKKYKVDGNEQLSSMFLSFLPEIPQVNTIKIITNPSIISTAEHFNFNHFYTRLSDVLLSIPGLHEPESLFEFCSEYLEVLRKDVIYNGADDEANEKLQGQAQFDRQRRFAALIKHAGKFGLRSRRAAPVSSEELLKSSLTMDPKNTGLNEEGFRSCAIVRNMVIRLLNQLNSQKQPHILKQVSVQMLAHIRGITEFGFSWLHKSLASFEKLNEVIAWIKSTGNRLSIFAANANSDQHPRVFTASSQFTDIFNFTKLHLEGCLINAKMLQKLVASAPTKSLNSSTNPDVNILSCLRNVAIHKEHSKYEELKSRVDNIVKCFAKMDTICADYENLHVEHIWKIADSENFISAVSKEVEVAFDLVDNPDLCEHFPSNLQKLKDDVSRLAENIRRDIHYETPSLGTVDFITSDVFHRRMQQILKAVESKCNEPQEPLDIFKKIVIGCSSGIDFTQDISNLHSLMDQLCHGFDASKDNLLRYAGLTIELVDTLELVQSVLIQFANSVAAFYIHFGHVSSQILQKGLVNPIPKKEEAEGGQGKDMEDVGGENAGMGEGQGMKDVSEQIEETGQVDDLQNDDENDIGDNQQPQEKPKDSETPLEMEDDFAADLENLDNDDNEKGEPDEEQNMDWDMGNVEEPEENQLDPNLWDKPNQEDKSLDDRPDGADNKTEDLAAKEDDDIVASENKQENNEDEKNQEEMEEEKNEGPDLENVNQNNIVDDDDENNQAPQDDTPEVSETPIDEGDDVTDAEEEGNEEPETTLDNDETVEEVAEEFENDKGVDKTEEGAQSDEVEKSNQGQSASEDSNKKDSHNNEINDEKENVDGEEGSKTEGDDKNDTKTASTTSTAKKDAEKADDEDLNDASIEEHDTQQKQHAQPTEEDEPMDVDKGDVDENMEDDQTDENSKNLAHINDDQVSSRDQLVVQKSTVEEARSTRSHYDRLKSNYDESLGADDNKMEEKLDQDINEETFVLNDEERKHTVIHISTDFFDLSNQAVNSLSNVQPEINTSDAEISDASKFAYLSDSVSLMASELAENLRQILEPSIANRLQGDYRTGKRLNMRRLVSYIASDYRKNRIWLRRTKKQQRNFQIMIAVDDSQSMGENHMGEITCQSVCLIEKAFRQLEIGQLAICKFGQTVQMLRNFASATDAQDTLVPSLLENLRFDQNKTDLLGLLSYASETFADAKNNTSSSSIPVQMLVIIGDGHGAFAQGRDPLITALKEMEHQHITVLYVIVDGKNSLLKMNYTTFEGAKPKMIPYMSMFPFNFYALVRSISTLPGTLAEAIRQWFEMALQE